MLVTSFGRIDIRGRSNPIQATQPGVCVQSSLLRRRRQSSMVISALMSAYEARCRARDLCPYIPRGKRIRLSCSVCGGVRGRCTGIAKTRIVALADRISHTPEILVESRSFRSDRRLCSDSGRRQLIRLPGRMSRCMGLGSETDIRALDLLVFRLICRVLAIDDMEVITVDHRQLFRHLRNFLTHQRSPVFCFWAICRKTSDIIPSTRFASDSNRVSLRVMRRVSSVCRLWSCSCFTFSAASSRRTSANNDPNKRSATAFTSSDVAAV